MSIQNFGKGALRVAKNYTKGYSDVQAKVRESTSNDPWGPSGTQMNEIAQMTYNQNDFVEIMEMLDKRLNDKGKNWRHVFKSLTVLDYLLHAGSENVVVYFRDNIYIIKTLKEFQFVDEYGKDQGANVRQKAKDITNLLADDARLRQERRSRAHMRDRMLGEGEEEPSHDTPRFAPPSDENAVRRGGAGGQTDDELKRAIEASKRSLAEEQARAGEDRDLAAAIKASQEEEERRARAVAESNGNLFDDQSNNLLLDATPQFNNGLQPQFTAVQPQFTSFNPYQQQAQQEAMQAEYLRQQQEWLRQQQEAQAQAQAQAQLQAQQEEWLRQQQLLQYQQQAALQQQQQQQAAQQQAALQAQQASFHSNNPFALTSPAPPQQQPSPAPPQVSSLSNFSLPATYESHAPTTHLSSLSPSPTPPQPSKSPARGPTRADQEHAQLAGLFAAPREDGLDTFGNIGALRYGHTDAGRLVAQKTGAAPQSNHNPFAAQQQQQQQQQQSEQPFFSI
ncbi:ENTH-domain-containing protein [Artomyces pyxidatus]|uniref:ENTH-domain-containing protein n=1 Tax=Artomyces pyxidatus TaxID=48021 RepID=A0ACB8SSJ1_9AGAM|nr:ENTH-domain-containing protein [Artomyces pyxidatus]